MPPYNSGQTIVKEMFYTFMTQFIMGGSELMTVNYVLKSEWPPRQAVTPDSIYQGQPPNVHPITFEPTDASAQAHRSEHII